MPRGVRKNVSLEDLDGIILENTVGYSLYKLGEKQSVKYVGLIKLIEAMNIEEHNNEYIENLKKQLAEYGEDGYNFLDFDKDGIHRNGTEFSDSGINARGWIRQQTPKGESLKPINGFTASYQDLEGYNNEGFNSEGYTREGIDRKGRDREGFYVDTKFNDAGIHKETGTEYGPDGYNVKGYNIDGYDRDGKNKNGKTIEDIDEQKNQQRKNYLGLMSLAKGYATGEITIEDYLKNHKISLEELIAFAKQQNMDKDTIVGLYRKKGEYNQYKTKFNKADYFKNKTTINGIEVTSEMVDKILDYLKANDRYLSLKVVNEHIRAYVNGELVIEDKEDENKEKGQAKDPYINEMGEIVRPSANKSLEYLPISINLNESFMEIAKNQKVRDINKGNSEIKTNYKELENPTQTKEEEKDLED